MYQEWKPNLFWYFILWDALHIAIPKALFGMKYYYMISLWTVRKKAEVILYEYKIYTKPKPPPTRHILTIVQQHGKW